MNPQLNSQQVIFVLGTALAIGAVLILVIAILLRSLRKERKEMSISPGAPRATDDPVFLISSLQAVVAGLKAREKELETLLRDAETRADVSQRTLETIVRATPQGLMIFDVVGTLSIANHAARNMLNLDTWARRRYTDLFTPESQLTLAIRACLENPTAPKSSRARYTSPEATARAFDVSLRPFVGRGGQTAGVVCIFTLTPAKDNSQPALTP
jgi:PAS domain-containing protein